MNRIDQLQLYGATIMAHLEDTLLLAEAIQSQTHTASEFTDLFREIRNRTEYITNAIDSSGILMGDP